MILPIKNEGMAHFAAIFSMREFTTFALEYSIDPSEYAALIKDAEGLENG